VSKPGEGYGACLTCGVQLPQGFLCTPCKRANRMALVRAVLAELKCEHPAYQAVESYYHEVLWCPDCGAVSGTNGLFGSRFVRLDWQLPGICKK
jgi:hypothetical protein